jgi:hypothetical protein
MRDNRSRISRPYRPLIRATLAYPPPELISYSDCGKDRKPSLHYLTRDLDFMFAAFRSFRILRFDQAWLWLT